MPKYVVSSTVTDPQWNNTTVLSSSTTSPALKADRRRPDLRAGQHAADPGPAQGRPGRRDAADGLPGDPRQRPRPFPDDAVDKVRLTLVDTTTYTNGVQYQVLRTVTLTPPRATLSQRRRRRFGGMESYAEGRDRAAAARGDHRRQLRAHRRGPSRPRGAGRVRDRPALDLGRAGPRRRRRRPRADRGRARARATGSASGRRTAPSGRSTQYAAAKAGVVLVNVNPAYRTHELAYAVNQSGHRAADRRGDAASRPASTGRWSRRPRRSAPRSSARSTSDTDDWAELVASGEQLPERRAGGAGGRRSRRRTRSTSSTRPAPPAGPRAPRSATATSSTTATSSPS